MKIINFLKIAFVILNLSINQCVKLKISEKKNEQVFMPFPPSPTNFITSKLIPSNIAIVPHVTNFIRSTTTLQPSNYIECILKEGPLNIKKSNIDDNLLLVNVSMNLNNFIVKLFNDTTEILRLKMIEIESVQKSLDNDKCFKMAVNGNIYEFCEVKNVCSSGEWIRDITKFKTECVDISGFSDSNITQDVQRLSKEEESEEHKSQKIFKKFINTANKILNKITKIDSNLQDKKNDVNNKPTNINEINQEPKKMKVEPKIIKEEPKIINEEPKLIKEEPKLIKEEPKIINEETKLIKEEPKLIKEEPKVFKLEPRVFKSEPMAIKEDPKVIEPIKAVPKLNPNEVDKVNKEDCKCPSQSPCCNMRTFNEDEIFEKKFKRILRKQKLQNRKLQKALESIEICKEEDKKENKPDEKMENKPEDKKEIPTESKLNRVEDNKDCNGSKEENKIKQMIQDAINEQIVKNSLIKTEKLPKLNEPNGQINKENQSDVNNLNNQLNKNTDQGSHNNRQGKINDKNENKGDNNLNSNNLLQKILEKLESIQSQPSKLINQFEDKKLSNNGFQSSTYNLHDKQNNFNKLPNAQLQRTFQSPMGRGSSSSNMSHNVTRQLRNSQINSDSSLGKLGNPVSNDNKTSNLHQMSGVPSSKNQKSQENQGNNENNFSPETSEQGEANEIRNSGTSSASQSQTEGPENNSGSTSDPNTSSDSTSDPNTSSDSTADPDTTSDSTADPKTTSDSTADPNTTSDSNNPQNTQETNSSTTTLSQGQVQTIGSTTTTTQTQTKVDQNANKSKNSQINKENLPTNKSNQSKTITKAATKTTSQKSEPAKKPIAPKKSEAMKPVVGKDVPKKPVAAKKSEIKKKIVQKKVVSSKSSPNHHLLKTPVKENSGKKDEKKSNDKKLNEKKSEGKKKETIKSTNKESKTEEDGNKEENDKNNEDEKLKTEEVEQTQQIQVEKIKKNKRNSSSNSSSSYYTLKSNSHSNKQSRVTNTNNTFNDSSYEICFTSNPSKMLDYWQSELMNNELKHYALTSSNFCYLCCQNELPGRNLHSKCCQERCDVIQLKSLHVSVACIDHHADLNNKGYELPKYDDRLLGNYEDVITVRTPYYYPGQILY